MIITRHDPGFLHPAQCARPNLSILQHDDPYFTGQLPPWSNPVAGVAQETHKEQYLVIEDFNI